MNGKNNMNGLAGDLLVLGVILIIGLIAGASDSSANTCIKSGCNNTRASGSSYCYIHKPYSGSSTRSSGSSSKTYSTGTGGGASSGTTSNKNNTSSYTGGSTTRRTSGATTTRTYNTLNNDPEDYDDPEEYADDAWGDDFDDWDEAYDYWEDY